MQAQFERPAIERAVFIHADDGEQIKQGTIGADDQVLAVVDTVVSVIDRACPAAEAVGGFDQCDRTSVARQFDGRGDSGPSAADDDVHFRRKPFCAGAASAIFPGARSSTPATACGSASA